MPLSSRAEICSFWGGHKKRRRRPIASDHDALVATRRADNRKTASAMLLALSTARLGPNAAEDSGIPSLESHDVVSFASLLDDQLIDRGLLVRCGVPAALADVPARGRAKVGCCAAAVWMRVCDCRRGGGSCFSFLQLPEVGAWFDELEDASVCQVVVHNDCDRHSTSGSAMCERRGGRNRWVKRTPLSRTPSHFPRSLAAFSVR